VLFRSGVILDIKERYCRRFKIKPFPSDSCPAFDKRKIFTRLKNTKDP
jgi:hypothetical protein